MKILDGRDGLLDQVLDRGGLGLHPRFADSEDVALHFVQQRIHFAFIIVHPSHDLRAGVDHLPEQVLLHHDVEVITQVGRGGHRIRQAGEVGDPANFFQQLLILELLLQRDHINGLAGIVHLDQCAEDRLMAEVVEDFSPLLESPDALPHAVVGREQHAAQDALLGFRRMGRQPIQFGSIGGRRFPAWRSLQIRWRAGVC